MGANVALPYESKDQKIQDMNALGQSQGQISGDINRDLKNNVKAKRDGTFLRSKELMCRDYDESNLPWPIKPVVKLDYCWRVTFVMWKHSFVLALPLTMGHFIWVRTPHVWSYTMKTLPKLLLSLNFLVCVLIINTLNISFSLMFEPYCDRQSSIYNPRVRNSQALRSLIRSTNETHKKTLQGKSNQALSSDEILGQSRSRSDQKK